MKRTLIAALTLLVALSSAEDLGTIKRAIADQTNKLNKAYAAKKLEVVKSFLTDDFVAESPQGQLVSKPEYLERVTAFLQLLTITKAESTIKSVKMQKGVAIVLSDNIANGKMKLNNGKSGVYKSKYQSREQWVKKNGVWKLHYAKDLPGGKTTVDGKVIKDG